MTKYRTIVIDPPWKVSRFSPTVGGHAPYNEMPYKMMTVKEIAAFPIDDFAAERSDLFMWVIQSKVDDAIDILRGWGFCYNRIITWDKANGPNIQGFTNHTELLIYAFRGKMGINKRSPLLRTIYHAKRTKHSEKPAVIYKDLVRCTTEPRIDIFARRRHPGFDAYGDQVEDAVQETL